ncbi:MAG TPA: DNA translocase FtsK, partial [Anaerolineae bacterium]|nr:DNA translocase FtsK [Anaerolineae bacterium]
MTKENLRPPTDNDAPQTWDERWLPVVYNYWAEICGGFLLLFSLLNLLALLNLTSAGLLRYTTGLARQLLGWGAFVLFLSLGLLGMQMLGRQLRFRRHIPARLIIAVELLFLITLPLTHYVTRATFEQAFAGQAGGLTGWAMAAPLLRFLGPVMTLLFYALLALIAYAILTERTLDDMIRSLVFASGRLKRWSDQLAIDPDEEPLRTVANYVEESRPFTTGAEDDVLLPVLLRPNLTPSQHRPIHPPAPENLPAPSLSSLPPLDILTAGTRQKITPEQIDHNAKIIEQTLTDFGLDGQVVSVRSGPSLTQFGVEPGYIVRMNAQGEIIKSQKVRISQIANLRKDFALALAVPRLRIEAPVPGRGIVGIEVPNEQTSMVRLRDVIESAEFIKLRKPLAIALGENVAGVPIAIDIAKMPHLLIAGTTGSGKSVCMKTLITSLIMRNSPETLRLVMIDPKRVEMLRFNGLPHLYGKAEVEGERIIAVLRWLVAEMERRYAVFAESNARQLSSYNVKAREQGVSPLPHIVVFLDELADLMMQYSAETERVLCRLAQMARATGIHLVVATQRPSTDVVTGLIKANFPARIAFAVSSSMDSRVILDTTGADQLLGNGDMLFLGSDAAVPQRVQGCFVDDDEIDRLV